MRLGNGLVLHRRSFIKILQYPAGAAATQGQAAELPRWRSLSAVEGKPTVDSHASLSRDEFLNSLFWSSEDRDGGVAGVVGIESGVVSGVFNLESSGVGASDRRPRHDKSYHKARFLTATK